MPDLSTKPNINLQPTVNHSYTDSELTRAKTSQSQRRGCSNSRIHIKMTRKEQLKQATPPPLPQLSAVLPEWHLKAALFSLHVSVRGKAAHIPLYLSHCVERRVNTIMPALSQQERLWRPTGHENGIVLHQRQPGGPEGPRLSSLGRSQDLMMHRLDQSGTNRK